MGFNSGFKGLNNFYNFKAGHSSEFKIDLCRFFTALICRDRCKIISFSVSEKMLKQCQYSTGHTAVFLFLPKFLCATVRCT